MDLAPVFAENRRITASPAAMAERVRELASVVAEDYGGDASRIWSEAKDGADLRKRIASLPGFGEMKISRSARCSRSNSASRPRRSSRRRIRRSVT